MKRIILLSLFFLTLSTVFAENTLSENSVIVPIFGNSSPTLGQTHNYTANPGTTITPSWVVTGGTVVNSGYNDPEFPGLYWADVVWNTAGSQSITLKNKWATVGSKSVTVIGVPNPPTVTASANPVCSGTSVTFTAESAYDKWYTAASGGSLLHTGLTYTNVMNATTTYHVAGGNSSGGLSTTRTAFTLNVNPLQP
ncbi:MAG: hypothetical protein GY816_15420 [Cytophagales bacterium]|nr:hypothetical protein [Cytophagales bacterium]